MSKRPDALKGKDRAAATKRERVSIDFPSDLMEKARDAVFWTPGLTLVALAEEALRREIARRERQQGAPFRRRTAELKTGRSVRKAS